MGRLEGKVAIITGGARGMGASHAEVFVKEGAKVVITDILDGQETAEKLGPNCTFMKHDVTLREDWERVVKETDKLYGPVTVLVNNAGIAKLKPWDQTTDEDYDIHYRINQLGVYLGMQITAPFMIKAGIGSIVNISSIAGMAGGANALPYVATKFAVRGMTKAAAIDWGPMNIRVNSVHPGVIRTPMTMENPDVDKSLVEQMGELSPLKRIADAIEITNLVLYLASDESSFSTGSEFIADGGQIAGF